MNTLPRCPWCGDDPLYVAYHDEEWGVPSHDDAHLFEMLILEGQQAGLSWITILRKRAHFREALEGFDPERIARFTPARIDKLMGNPAIIRNRQKLNAAVKNAVAFLRIQAQHGSFDRYIWSFVQHSPIQGQYRTLKQVPTVTDKAIEMSKALKKAGFTFVGPTICYSFMQAVGMANDHLLSCHRYDPIRRRVESPRPPA